MGTSTVGFAAPAQASPQTFTNGSGVRAITLSGAGTNLVQSGRGRLCRVVVTTAIATSLIFYDTTNTVSQTGATIVGYLNATVGTVGSVIDLEMPFRNGLV